MKQEHHLIQKSLFSIKTLDIQMSGMDIAFYGSIEFSHL